MKLRSAQLRLRPALVVDQPLKMGCRAILIGVAASLNRELEMTYSTDFRRRVIARVQSGDSKSAACRLFGISRSTLHSWLGRPDLSPSQGGPRRRKLDRHAFGRHVSEHPDALQRERAAHFKVSVGSIRHALGRMGATRKKNRPATAKGTPQAGSSTSRT